MNETQAAQKAHGVPEKFVCPENMLGHLQKVFLGEYDIPLVSKENDGFRILDLGANCGAFALWACARWPNSTVWAYEPVPETFAWLRQNIEAYPEYKIHATEAAVFGLARGRTEIRLGRNNCGEASLFRTGVDSGEAVEVATLPAVELPHADIIKLDIEGAELDVLHSLISRERRHFHAVLLEYHSEDLRRMLDVLLSGYVLTKADLACPGRGTLCYINRALFPR